MGKWLINKHWSRGQEIAHCRSMQKEWRMKELYLENRGNQDKLFEALNKEYGWSESQAYMATEFLYRPENFN